MVTILHDLIMEALSKGYTREYLRIQVSEGFHKYLIDMSQLVSIKEEYSNISMRQFMGVKVEMLWNIAGEGFILLHDSPNYNNEIRPVYTTPIGIYSNYLGLPIK